MPLNKEFFDAIQIDVVKKKYYNANKVNALLDEIRAQAETMYEENLSMRSQLEAFNGRKSEIGDAVLSAQGIYRDIIEKAELRSEAIVKQAEERAAALIKEAEQRKAALIEELERQQEYTVARVEAMFDRMRKRHESGIENLNAEWQSFLCGLYTEDELSAPTVAAKAPTEKAAAPAKQPVAPAFASESEAAPLPPEVSETLGRIAETMFSIGES